MDSNFFCYAATVLSPHRNVLIFTQRMHKPTGRPFTPKKSFTVHFKRVFFVLKDLDQSQLLQTIARKVYNFTCSRHRISVLFKLRPDCVIWKTVEK